MASMSVCNLASHIAAVAYANFIPTVKKWDAPRGLPQGCKNLLNIMKRVTGSHFKPILPAFLLNEDSSSQYYFSDSARNDCANSGWSRVKDDSLKTRGKDSLWTTGNNDKHPSSGIRVKFACGGSAGGFLYPICVLVSNLSSQELPSEDFHVYPIPGLAINGHIDPRCEDVGYLCLMALMYHNNVSLNGFMKKSHVKQWM